MQKNIEKAFETGLRFTFNIEQYYDKNKKKSQTQIKDNNLHKNAKNIVVLPKINKINGMDSDNFSKRLSIENNNNNNSAYVDTELNRITSMKEVTKSSFRKLNLSPEKYEVINIENKYVLNINNETNNLEKEESSNFQQNSSKAFQNKNKNLYSNKKLNLESIHDSTSTDQNKLEDDEKSFRRDIVGPVKKHSALINRETEEMKFLLDNKDFKFNNKQIQKMKTFSLSKAHSIMRRSYQTGESSNFENEENKTGERFSKLKSILGTKENFNNVNNNNNSINNSNNNHNQENNIENSEETVNSVKNSEENERKSINNYDDFWLPKKPKRKIHIEIFTQKNRNHQEMKELDSLLKKFEDNTQKEEKERITNDDSEELKLKNKQKREVLESSPLKHPIQHSEYNKYGLYSGFKKQELKMKYGYNILKKKKLTTSKNKSFEAQKINSLSEERKEKSGSHSPKNVKKSLKNKLPKIKEKLKVIYKEDPRIIKLIKNLKKINNLNLDEYQQKLMDVAKRFLDDDNLKILAGRFKEINEINQIKEKTKFHKSANRWEIMVKAISRYIPEFLVEKLKTQK